MRFEPRNGFDLPPHSLVGSAARPGGAGTIEIQQDPPPADLGLDPGETAAILIAEAIGADALLIDERRGRAVATGRGIAVVGTLGLIAGARRVGAIDRAAPLIASLRADGFWLSDRLVAEFLRELGEVAL